MSYNMMIGYDIYGRFTMEHFPLRQRMTFTTKMYCSQLQWQQKKINEFIPIFCDLLEDKIKNHCDLGFVSVSRLSTKKLTSTLVNK
jgi:hypothetical protein